MDQKNTFQELARAARDDAPPLVDVAKSVLKDVGAVKSPREMLPWIFAAASSAAAAAVITIAVRVLIARQNVEPGLIDSLFQTVM